jgi:tetratricopeptide (TPR) repeat protein
MLQFILIQKMRSYGWPPAYARPSLSAAPRTPCFLPSSIVPKIGWQKMSCLKIRSKNGIPQSGARIRQILEGSRIKYYAIPGGRIIMKWLTRTWSFGRLRGVDFRFHVSILFSLPIAYYLFRPVDFREMALAFLWVIGIILCVFLHEFGHTLAAQAVGVQVKNITIWLLGGVTNLNNKAGNPLDNLVIYTAGPLVNMFLAFLFVLGYMTAEFIVLPNIHASETFLWVQTIINLSFSFAFINLVLVVFNLLPIYPLDGGNIIHSAIEMYLGRQNADLITFIVGLPVLLGLVFLGLLLRDYLLLFSCLLIALATSSLNRSIFRQVNLGINYLFKRAAYYYMQGDFERAAQYSSEDIEREPQNPNNYLARAAALINILQKDRAVADVDRALKLAPENPLALQLRGEMYVLDKKFDEALGLFAQAQKINPNWGVPYFDRGSVFLERKEYQTALEEFNKAISLSPQTWLFYLIRSIVHFKLGKVESAHRDQDSALQLSEIDSLVMSDLNMIVYQDCLDWAEDYYERVLLKGLYAEYVYHGRADAYRVNALYEKAIEDYTSAIKINPDDPRLFLGRGKAFSSMADVEKAISDFRLASSLSDKLHVKRQAEMLVNNLEVLSKPSHIQFLKEIP